MSQSPSPQTVNDLPHEFFVENQVEFFVARVTYFDSGEIASYSKIGPYVTVEEAKDQQQWLDEQNQTASYVASHTVVKVTRVCEVIS